MAPFARLGPYIIERSLGSGGMGSVFLGVDEESGQRAAVKVLSPALAAEPNFRERFGTEIETLKKLRHPHIVQLLGYGEQDGQLFYAMEMIEGRTLQQELQAGRRFEWRAVARIGVQICQALKHAHDRGVIHRDLKPANLLFTSDEQVKLADFGIAKLYGMTQLTVAGGVIGTADFMSPEQADGKAVTTRSDLYSLGSVMFTLLTGRPPFASRSAAEVIHKLHYEQPLAVRRLAPDTPEEFELIIAQLLEKDPPQRIATAMAVANRLRAMEFALSPETRIATQSDAFDLADDHEYHLADDIDDQPTAIAGAETRVISPEDIEMRAYLDAIEQHRQPTVAMPGAAGPGTSDDQAERTASTHFTTFDDAARQRAAALAGPEENTPLWLKIAPLLAACVAIIAAVWYFSKPPSADALYQKIMEVAKEGETSDLLRVESSIDEFLFRYPDSDHRDDIQALQDELDLYRLQRKYQRRARLRGGTEALGPVERAYVDATRLAESDPHAAMLKLGALLDVFSGTAEPEQSEADKRCLRLAREQLDSLQARLREVTVKDLLAIGDRLDEADSLDTSDPKRAAAIRRGVIELYGKSPWAESLVARARAGLDTENHGEDEGATR